MKTRVGQIQANEPRTGQIKADRPRIGQIKQVYTTPKFSNIKG